MGSSLARVSCETSQILLAGDQVVVPRDFPISPHLVIDLAQNKWNNLDGPLNPNQKKKKKKKKGWSQVYERIHTGKKPYKLGESYCSEEAITTATNSATYLKRIHR